MLSSPEDSDPSALFPMDLVGRLRGKRIRRALGGAECHQRIKLGNFANSNSLDVDLECPVSGTRPSTRRTPPRANARCSSAMSTMERAHRAYCISIWPSLRATSRYKVTIITSTRVTDVLADGSNRTA